MNKGLEQSIIRLNESWELFLSNTNLKAKALPKKDKKAWGECGAKIAQAVLWLQRQAIEKDIKIYMPSIKALSIYANCSETHVWVVLNKLIKSKQLHFKNYFSIDENGELVTDKLGHRVTSGRLRMLLNPFKGIKEYIQKKKSGRSLMASNYVEDGFERFVKKYFNRFKGYVKKYTEGYIYHKKETESEIDDSLEWSDFANNF